MEKKPSYIGIPLSSEQESALRWALVEILPGVHIRRGLHLTIDYLGAEKVEQYGKSILSKIHDIIHDQWSPQYVFDRITLMRDRYSLAYLFVLAPNDTSQVALQTLYASTNISELGSQYLPTEWTPHITLSKIPNSIMGPDECTIPYPIVLSLADASIH